MLRLRWSDVDTANASVPVDWRGPALICATLFLNLQFWEVNHFSLCALGPPPVYAVASLGAALFIVALFFLGPALATQRSHRSLHHVVENSLGSIPALGVKICCALFALRLLTTTQEALISWLLPWGLPLVLHRLSYSCVLAFLFYTSLQSLETNARLSRFTIKLGLAILLAAFLRVEQGWPLALRACESDCWFGNPYRTWNELLLLVSGVGPLAFLAGDFGNHSPDRIQILKIGLLGLVLPLCATLTIVNFISVATLNSSAYQPSLEPGIPMALFAHVQRRYIAPGAMIVALTTFGASRFNLRAFAQSFSVLNSGRRWPWPVIVILAGVIPWLPQYGFQSFFQWPATCLTVTAAILTADFITATWRVAPTRKVDWVSSSALVAGLVTPWCFSIATANPWLNVSWHPFLLHAYASGFTVCLIGRWLTKQTQSALIRA